MFSFKKIIVLLFIAGILFGLFTLPPKKTNAAAVIYDPLEQLNEFVIKPLVRKIANSLESKLVNSVNKQLAKIDGRLPSFITNWRNHLLDSQGRGNDVFRAVLADAQICGFMSNNVKRAFGADLFAGVLQSGRVTNSSGQVTYENKTTAPGTVSFQSVANCTLPGNFNVDAFKDDFTQGGWDAWDRLLEPQNNLFGLYALALNEQDKQVEIDKQASMNAAVAGQGFLSQKLGIGDAGLGPTSCVSGANSRCVFLGKIVTPEKILGESAANALDTKFKTLGGASYLTDVVLSMFAAVLDGTTSRIANYANSAYDELVSDNNYYNENQVNPGASDPNFDNQVDSISQGTQDRAAQNESTANDAAGKLDNLDTNTCMDTCRADGNDDVTCNNRCNPGSVPQEPQAP